MLPRARTPNAKINGFFQAHWPDNVAVLAPLSISRTRVESVVVVALWGCGHDVENGECDVSVYESRDSNPIVGKKKISFATFATRIVHGLQPNTLMMVLPALVIPLCLADDAFLIMFLFGIVVAMGSYTIFIGSCSEALKGKGT
ncbi:hypothetical protein VNO78_17822 [Psophocarpus tetragonolobus]|uniref:Uncharacterized protein n=1 Tax=Psophocarpus tetragonolobus TaxID=3891 RepID=A0AAN9SIR1_PSOTE